MPRKFKIFDSAKQLWVNLLSDKNIEITDNTSFNSSYLNEVVPKIRTELDTKIENAYETVEILNLTGEPQAILDNRDSNSALRIQEGNGIRLEYDSQSNTIIISSASYQPRTLSGYSTTFSGGRSIPHTFQEAPKNVLISLTQSPNGYLGEIWYTADTSAVTVYRSGTAESSFSYLIFDTYETIPFVSKGKGVFNSLEGRTIPHNLGSKPDTVQITISSNPSGYLGEYWYTADETNIYVYTTGTTNTEFSWIAFGSESSLSTMEDGLGVFNSIDGYTFNHNLGSAPKGVYITPSEALNGSLGEIWYTATDTTITVYNSGASKGKGFAYLIESSANTSSGSPTALSRTTIQTMTASGRDYFNANGTIIEHFLGSKPNSVNITLNEAPNGTLNNYWYNADDQYIYVYYDGENVTSGFDWTASL